jgi:hypothetical protein
LLGDMLRLSPIDVIAQKEGGIYDVSKIKTTEIYFVQNNDLLSFSAA